MFSAHCRRWLGLLALLPVTAAAGEDSRDAAAKPVAVRAAEHADTLFLDCEEVAAALDWEFKIVHPDRLVTFCRTEDKGICIPVQLDAQNHRDEDGLLVAAEVLTRALRFRVEQRGGQVVVRPGKPQPPATDNEDLPAYNAAWGAGRGFRSGQTLPDIPLTDMQGREVRFSQFLGQRYILYCWASW